MGHAMRQKRRRPRWWRPAKSFLWDVLLVAGFVFVFAWGDEIMPPHLELLSTLCLIILAVVRTVREWLAYKTTRLEQTTHADANAQDQ